MSRSGSLAALLLLALAATAVAAIKPLESLDHTEPAGRIAGTNGAAHGLLEEEPAARIAAANGLLEEEPAALLASVRGEEKKDGGDAATIPMEGTKPSGGVAIQQGGDPGTVPSPVSGSGEHAGKEQSGAHGKEESGSGSGISKEGQKSAGKSCLTKEECHKKRLLCGKGCTLSAHAKCAAKCSKSCIATC